MFMLYDCLGMQKIEGKTKKFKIKSGIISQDKKERDRNQSY
jgi:hypothetical protein